MPMIKKRLMYGINLLLFYHAFALLFVSLYAQQNKSRLIPYISLFLIIGILLFSGSIYLLCALKSANTVGLSGLGILTPLGGLFFIAGWITLILSIKELKN